MYFPAPEYVSHSFIFPDTKCGAGHVFIATNQAAHIDEGEEGKKDYLKLTIAAFDILPFTENLYSSSSLHRVLNFD